MSRFITNEEDRIAKRTNFKPEFYSIMREIVPGYRLSVGKKKLPYVKYGVRFNELLRKIVNPKETIISVNLFEDDLDNELFILQQNVKEMGEIVNDVLGSHNICGSNIVNLLRKKAFLRKKVSRLQYLNEHVRFEQRFVRKQCRIDGCDRNVQFSDWSDRVRAIPYYKTVCPTHNEDENRSTI